jgi:cell division septum initiation protein DivIVA
MSNPGPATSIADLERLLDEKKARLQDLVQERDRLQKELDKLDAQIQGAASVDSPLTRRPRGKRRQKNEMSLKAAVQQVLTKNKKGLSLADLETAVTDTGYRSGSINFRNVLYQAVYNSAEIGRDEKSGLYKLQK